MTHVCFRSFTRIAPAKVLSSVQQYVVHFSYRSENIIHSGTEIVLVCVISVVQQCHNVVVIYNASFIAYSIFTVQYPGF